MNEKQSQVCQCKLWSQLVSWEQAINLEEINRKWESNRGWISFPHISDTTHVHREDMKRPRGMQTSKKILRTAWTFNALPNNLNSDKLAKMKALQDFWERVMGDNTLCVVERILRSECISRMRLFLNIESKLIEGINSMNIW